MKLPHLLLLIFFAAAIHSGAQAADGSAAPTTTKFDITPLITSGLLDRDAPLDHRRELANRLIDAADSSKDPALLYLVGTLYRQGDEAGIAPFAKDLDRAREYLTRAALGGHVAAMGKLAVVELDSGNRFEANLWAQMFVYYDVENDTPKAATRHAARKPTGGESLASALLEQTNDGFSKSDMPRLLERMKAMIARYDPVIRAYQAELVADRQRNPPPQMAESNPFFITPLQLRQELGPKAASAVAEYLAELSPSGKLVRAWPFDGWPEQKVLRVLRPIVSGFEMKPSSEASTGNKVVLIPVIYVNSTYRLKQRGNSQ